jgi:hypothetical protein
LFAQAKNSRVQSLRASWQQDMNFLIRPAEQTVFILDLRDVILGNDPLAPDIAVARESRIQPVPGFAENP